MRLKSVRVQNYKCIEDSTEFSIEPVTCLVGKNESGKTALLQALYKLNPDIEKRKAFDLLEEYPRRNYSAYKSQHKENPDNILTTTWVLEKADQELIKEKVGENAIANNTVKFKKGYDNKIYFELNLQDENVLDFYYKKYGLDLDKISKLDNPKTINELIDKLESLETLSDQQSDLLDGLKIAFPNGDPKKTCIDILHKEMPIFLYFGSYYRLPGQISIDDLLKKRSENRLDSMDEVFLALLDLAGTSLDQVNQIKRYEELSAEMEAVSNRISQEIFEYWSQNSHLEVVCDIDHALPGDPAPFNTGIIFRIRIRNTRHKVTLGFEERSAGFVWFFSFLVWFSQLKKVYGKNLIILLDEPGLTLHGKAQADLLRYINDKLKPYHQVIYTTHSPFMIDPDNFLGIRTVEDVISGGTKVGDRVFSTDADTIFPLQAALGYEITQTLFIGNHTLLVEGPSDLLYVKWFSNELKNQGRTYLDPRWTIAPCGGIDKFGSFIALFGGNKLDIAILADFADGQKKKIRDLKESSILKRGHVFSAEMFVDQEEADIEDVLGRSFYIALINRCYSLEDSYLIPIKKPIDAPIRVLKEVEKHFSCLPDSRFPEFDHYRPSSFLIENSAELKTILPDIDIALNRFETIFIELNSLLCNE